MAKTGQAAKPAELLREGAGTVTEVAYSVDFNSLSHFHSCHRERFGAAPTPAQRAAAPSDDRTR